MQTIAVNGELTPQTLAEFATMLETVGADGCRIEIDSEGGAVDVGFQMATAIAMLQTSGVPVVTVAAGRVYSSAVLPFLAARRREMGPLGSIMVHRATMEPLAQDVGLRELQTQSEELSEYTQAMSDFYLQHGVKELAARYLWNQSEELLITDPLQAAALGFVTEKAAGGVLNRIISAAFRPETKPKFSYILNYKQITNTEMTKEEVRNEVSAMLGELRNELVKCFADELAKIQPAGAENKEQRLTGDELAKLDGVVYKTAVSVAEHPEVAAFAHLTEDLGDDRTVVALDADGKPVTLPEGEFEVAHDDEKTRVHSTGKVIYLIRKADEGAGKEAGGVEPEPENEEGGDKKSEEPKAEEKGKSEAPKVQAKNVAKGIRDTALQLRTAFAKYGTGAVGGRK